jgi:hypothetical protein
MSELYRVDARQIMRIASGLCVGLNVFVNPGLRVSGNLAGFEVSQADDSAGIKNSPVVTGQASSNDRAAFITPVPQKAASLINDDAQRFGYPTVCTINYSGVKVHVAAHKRAKIVRRRISEMLGAVLGFAGWVAESLFCEPAPKRHHFLVGQLIVRRNVGQFGHKGTDLRDGEPWRAYGGLAGYLSTRQAVWFVDYPADADAQKSGETAYRDGENGVHGLLKRLSQAEADGEQDDANEKPRCAATAAQARHDGREPAQHTENTEKWGDVDHETCPECEINRFEIVRPEQKNV